MSTCNATKQLVIEEASDFLPSQEGASRVDTQKRVIRGVRVLGLVSRNNGRVLGLTEQEFGEAVNRPYAYSMEAVRRAVPLYENATVYSNHLKFEVNDDGQRVFKQSVRANEEMIGWLRNVRAVEGHGLYADLEYIDSHPMSKALVEVALRNPSKLALSHEAGFDRPMLKGGRIVLTEITAVDGIALVNAKPGTTNGLFESYTETVAMEPEVKLDVAPAPEMPMEGEGKPVVEDAKAAMIRELTAKLESATPEQIQKAMDALSAPAMEAAPVHPLVEAPKPEDSAVEPEPSEGSESSKDEALESCGKAGECKAKMAGECLARSESLNIVLECLDLFRQAGYAGTPTRVAVEAVLSMPETARPQLVEQLALGTKHNSVVVIETKTQPTAKQVAEDTAKRYETPGSLAAALR